MASDKREEELPPDRMRAKGIPMRLRLIVFAGALSTIASAQNPPCDISAYKAADGLHAASSGGALHVEWRGEGDDSLRASFALDAGQPTVRELAA
jgi:hypothetical protein